MSLRYATVTNEQAAVQRRAQRDTGADVPGRTGADEKLGVAASDTLSKAFPQRARELSDHNPEAVYNEEMSEISGDANPDFRARVRLDFSSANFEEDLEAELMTSDLIQAGAPNVSTGNMNSPGFRPIPVILSRRDAGFGTREIDDLNVNVPSNTRDRIGNYFERHKRRDPDGFGTSKPVPKS